MAGAGWKVFSAGAVLTAAEVNTYLMDQSVQVFAGTAARAAALGTAVAEGMVSYRTDSNVLDVYDGSAWIPGVPISAWTTYTPALKGQTTDPTLGSSSTAAASYVQIGKTVIARIAFQFGTSGTNAGSGYYYITLPVTAATYSTGSALLGTFNATRVSVDSKVNGVVNALSSTQMVFRYNGSAAGNNFISNTAPWAWSTNDSISILLTYEAA